MPDKKTPDHKIVSDTHYSFYIQAIRRKIQGGQNTKGKFLLAKRQTPMKGKILIAEDDLISCEYLRELLHKEGFRVVTAKNGTEAVAACCDDPEIGLVLMDIKMPGLDGYSAAEKIRACRPELPVLAQTAYALDEERISILNAGFDDYIPKPIEKDVLLNMIAKFLRDA